MSDPTPLDPHAVLAKIQRAVHEWFAGGATPSRVHLGKQEVAALEPLLGALFNKVTVTPGNKPPSRTTRLGRGALLDTADPSVVLFVVRERADNLINLEV